jgi:DnaJ homolog subfamily C member 13
MWGRQTILFTRYASVLRPYKYAGYPMLIKTIERETADDGLFARCAEKLRERERDRVTE